jgi:acyl-CoA reductase-like NAD-dependent aldehyde dehydrogenase
MHCVGLRSVASWNTLDENNHVGPLIDTHAVQMYNHAFSKVVAEGGKIIVEGGVLSGEGYESGCYVKPALLKLIIHLKSYNTRHLPCIVLC